MTSLDLDQAVATFAEAPEFTVGVEEEFSILDPDTLELVPRFEELRDAAKSDPLLHEHITGELISSEIEIISGAGEDLRDARRRQRERRRALFALTGARGAEPVDLDELSRVIARIAAIAVALGDDVAELEINPLRAAGSRVEVLDALVSWSSAGDEKDAGEPA